MSKISVVINSLNEADTLERSINSVKWADEIIVCDMHSDDESTKIARKMGANIIYHKRLPFVEPARNYAVSKASNEWVLVLDPDEEIPESLAITIKELIGKDITSDYIRFPRKNYIFGKWMKATMWWPDYNIRLFKKGKVTWSGKIHIQPKTEGQGLDLPAEEKYAIIHHHYTSVSQYITRLDRYTTIQANNLVEDKYKFVWTDLISKPLGEFLGRYFANKGFEDGLHGLVLSLLQGVSHFIVYLKVWEKEKFEDQNVSLKDVSEQFKKSSAEINFWFKHSNLSKNPLKRFVQKVGNRLS